MKESIKKYIKYLLLVCMIVFAAGNVSSVKAAGAKSGTAGKNVTWKFENGVMTISGSGEMDDYQTIADWFTGELLEENITPWEDFKDEITKVVVEGDVTYIGYAAFADCYNLKEVVLSDNVKVLGTNSFANDKAITSISIGSGLEHIYSCALYGTSIKELYLPKGFQKIEDVNGLNGLYSLEKFVVEEGNAYYTAVNGVLYTKDKKAIVRVPGKIGASYTIPSTVTELKESSFSQSDIETITIPNTVKKIGNSCFSYCEKLKKIIFSSGLKEIPMYICFYCSELQEVIIPEGIETIGWRAFVYCSKLNSVEIPYSVTYIDEGFSENTKLNIASGDLRIRDGMTYQLYTDIKLDVSQKYTEAFKVLDLVNKERKAKGLSALKMDQSLLESAMLRAAELCIKNSHTRPDGTDCFTANTLMYGENIASGYGSAAAVMSGWMNSGGHKANILGDFKTIGIGCVEYKDNLYWVQCFGYDLSKAASKSSYTDGSKTRTICAVMLDTPVLSGVSNTTSGVKVSWKEVSGAKKYRVYRKTDGGSWKKICDTTSTSYVDKTAESGTKYTYTVQCLNTQDNSVASRYDKKGKSILYLKTPTLKATSCTTSGLKMSWSKTAGAKSYYVYLKTSTGWKKQAEVTGTSYTYKSATSGKKYTFTVRAVNGSTKSSCVSAGKTGLYLETPTLKATSCTTSGLKMSWSKTAGAKSYYVYLKTSTGWKKQAEVTGTSYTYKSAASGKKYTFTVRAVNGSTKSSRVSAGKTGLYLATPKLTSIAKVSGKVKLTWKSVSGAEKYYVYRKKAGGSWIRIKETTSLRYTDGSTLKKGTTYVYNVRAVKGSTLSSYNKTGLKIQ